ncbi:GTPase-activating protein gyp8 [Sporothrix stenoceras]|uniref:GTPase-activating protein gyp8 n=1 Tax=Sporothrix stenoceras TaxID=5173 RepID=A0ABR3ZEI9_9PEZI
MTSQDSGLGGGADTVPSTAEKILAPDSQQSREKALLTEGSEEKQHQRQDSLLLDGDSLDEKKDAQDDVLEITSDKSGGRLPASRQSSSRSISRSEKIEIPPVEDSPEVAAKKQGIRDACLQGDFARLKELAGSEGGFLTDELRQIAWPVLLGIPLDSDGYVDIEAAAAATGISKEQDSNSWESLPPHRDEEQVQLDVNRAFVYYPTHSNDAEEARQKQALSALIVEVLRRYPYLCYFQGFHDICQVFLLVLPPQLRTPTVVRLAALRIRDFMLPTIDAAVQQLLLLPDILRKADPPLWNHLRLAQHPRPFFALSGTLTMYAHDVQSLGAIARLFDVMLARPPAFSLYLFAAIVRAHREALFATPADEPEMLHHILSKLPGRAGGDRGGGNFDEDEGSGKSSTPPLDELIADAAQLAKDYPAHTLPAWRSIAASSVLKTADDRGTDKPLASGLTVADGERLFHEHVRELEAAERRRQQVARARQILWRYRGPMRAVGVAVLVGVVAVALRRSGVGAGASSPFLTGPVAKVSALLSRLGVHVG